MVLMITDGLTEERDTSEWQSILKTYDINLAMLLIKDRWIHNLSSRQAALVKKDTEAVITCREGQEKCSILAYIKNSGEVSVFFFCVLTLKVCHYVAFHAPETGSYTVHVEGVEEIVQVTHLTALSDNFLQEISPVNKITDEYEKLSVCLAELMANQFDEVMHNIGVGKTHGNAMITPCFGAELNFKHDIVITAKGITIDMARSQGSGPPLDRLFSVSSSISEIPNVPQDYVYVQVPRTTESIQIVISNLSVEYNKHATEVKFRDKLHEAQTKWAEASVALHGAIERMVSVFEESIFPINKFTRKKAHFRGSSLHLPGLIKAVMTDFNYKKFFSQKASGGKRMYSVCIALDVSLSMKGHLADCAIESLVILITSLRSIGVETYSLLLFGERVQ
jgi:hypothetical protein